MRRAETMWFDFQRLSIEFRLLGLLCITRLVTRGPLGRGIGEERHKQYYKLRKLIFLPHKIPKDTILQVALTVVSWVPRLWCDWCCSTQL